MPQRIRRWTRRWDCYPKRPTRRGLRLCDFYPDPLQTRVGRKYFCVQCSEGSLAIGYDWGTVQSTGECITRGCQLLRTCLLECAVLTGMRYCFLGLGANGVMPLGEQKCMGVRYGVVADQEESSLEIVKPVPINAKGPFLRIKRRSVPWWTSRWWNTVPSPSLLVRRKKPRPQKEGSPPERVG